MTMTTIADQVTTSKAVVEHLYELINNNELDKFATVAANDYIDRSNGSKGPEGMAAAAANLHRAYADLRIELVDVIAEGDLVAVRWLETGRHVGQFFNLKPTHKPFEARGINVYRVKKERIIESWLGIDPETIRAQQIGQQTLEAEPLSNRPAQKVVIDRFVVPRGSRTSFVEASGAVQNILKGVPGFVEGFVYETPDESGDCLFVTTVVWTDEGAFELAKELVAQKLRQLGLNPAEKMRALNVQIERGVFERTPF
jgi:predicted ester cyclase